LLFFDVVGVMVVVAVTHENVGKHTFLKALCLGGIIGFAGKDNPWNVIALAYNSSN